MHNRNDLTRAQPDQPTCVQQQARTHSSRPGGLTNQHKPGGQGQHQSYHGQTVARADLPCMHTSRQPQRVSTAALSDQRTNGDTTADQQSNTTPKYSVKSLTCLSASDSLPPPLSSGGSRAAIPQQPLQPLRHNRHKLTDLRTILT
jgi:hypothetical protein